ncbi:hypothetical protein [Sulfuracidifex metallicus]|uniref:hypothetical protein n=1 Tax=Sulfuracidifex metallicus TaxID=47303 RepID=UPI0022759707|nr:hypothetical protein [Sulfuracidifex metallicus]MCY0849750.1 hypothetical protein [Sulfuracidifex metallicus]
MLYRRLISVLLIFSVAALLLVYSYHTSFTYTTYVSVRVHVVPIYSIDPQGNRTYIDICNPYPEEAILVYGNYTCYLSPHGETTLPLLNGTFYFTLYMGQLKETVEIQGD